MEKTNQKPKRLGWGEITNLGTETVNDTENCKKIKVVSGLGKITLWIHPYKELNYEDF